MADVFGLPLRKRLAVTVTLAGLARRYGYDQVEIPLVERATSFSEEIVGRSPWPEWDQRGCFYLTVPDYHGSYDAAPVVTEALLIPEGTISVTRWLGRLLAKEPDFVFPLKLFYETTCFRNELVDGLDHLRRRQFTQFGLEVIGSPSGNSDIEAIRLIAASLRELGVPSRSVRVRAGDVAIFNRLTELSGLDAADTITLKEALDAIAECRAGKRLERQPALADSAKMLLRRAGVRTPWSQVWWDLLDGGDIGASLNITGDAYIAERFRRLQELATTLDTLNVTVEIDLCVVRSHEYYTGIAFEIDVLTATESFVEVGGGGRYDRLVGHFVPAAANIHTVPATGFAFGVERLVYLLDRLGLLGPDRTVSHTVGLRSATADVLVVPPLVPGGYLAAVRAADKYHVEGRAADIYLGVPERSASYAAARGIAETYTPPIPED